MKKAFLFFIIGILISSFFVYAAGVSTGGEVSSDRAEVRSADVRNERAVVDDCENVNIRKDRIKCRLENRPERSSVPESCRTAENRGRCVALYNAIGKCYELNARNKDQCLKRAIGLRAKLSDDVSTERKEKTRDYVVALLYDLQERVEKANELGKLDSEESAVIIEKITEIKESIGSGVNKMEIREMMKELKSLWKESIE